MGLERKVKSSAYHQPQPRDLSSTSSLAAFGVPWIFRLQAFFKGKQFSVTKGR
jgi:hypothetical protein